MYAGDYDEFFPCVQMVYPAPVGTKFWYDAVQPYLKSTQILQCPSEPNRAVGYGWNYPHAGYRLDLNHQVHMSKIAKPAEMFLFADSNTGSYWQYLYCACCWPVPPGIRDATNVVSDRHNEGANLGFVDGHAKWMKTATIISNNSATQALWGHPTPATVP